MPIASFAAVDAAMPGSYTEVAIPFERRLIVTEQPLRPEELGTLLPYAFIKQPSMLPGYLFAVAPRAKAVRPWLLVRLVAALLALSGAAAPTQQAPVFRSGTDAVPIWVAVTTAAGDPILDLTSDDFEVLDNGKRRQLVAFGPQAKLWLSPCSFPIRRA
jgi:hypothetical protein